MDGRQKLWLRSLDRLEVQPIPGTDDATYPFWSPDSRNIAFFAGRKLGRTEISSGSVQTICEATDGRGGTWSRDGRIVFAPAPLGPLSLVPAAGGTPVAVTRVDKETRTHRLPHFLPDGKRVLFFSGASVDASDNAIFCLDLDSRKVSLVARENSGGVFAQPGELLFQRGSTVFAQPMDLRSLRLTGTATPIAEGVWFNTPRWVGHFTVSDTGLLFGGAGLTQKYQLAWFEPGGARLATVGDPEYFRSEDLRVAPDGKAIAASIADPGGRSDIWLYDAARGVKTRFTFEAAGGYQPFWSPDGKQIAYGDANGNITIKASDGASPGRTLLAQGSVNPELMGWSPDGRFLALDYDQGKGGTDIFRVPVAGGGAPRPIVAGPGNQRNGRFSPDGKWFCYLSDESGRDELYVVPFPGPGGKWQISSGGATDGFWLGDGTTIAYWQSADSKLVAMDFHARAANADIGLPRPLFGGRSIPSVAISPSPNGKKFLLAVPAGGEAPYTLTVVSNWPTMLESR